MEHLFVTIPDTELVEDWINFLGKKRPKASRKQPKAVCFDFSHVRFLRPYHITSLACLIEEYFINGVKIEFKIDDIDKRVKKYLDDIKFFNYWEDGFNRNRYTETKIDTVLCLWKINYEMIDAYANAAMEFFSRHHLPNKDLYGFYNAIAEVINNINDHSHSEVSGYIISQYYPKEKQLILSVCDFGIGIAESVKRFLQVLGEEVENSDVVNLKKAIEEGFTTGSTSRNKGLGLASIDSNINGYGKRFLILSNRGLYVREKSTFTTNELNNELEGTIIVIKFDVTSMDELENNVENDVYNL